MSYDLYAMEDGNLLKTHSARLCDGNICCVHNPSHHIMIEFPQHWRSDRNLMERTCPHGIGHPDPDDIAYKRTIFGDRFADAESVHGCDGCCGGWTPPTPETTPTLWDLTRWAALAWWEWIKSFFARG
jgi:hypothetical protein